MDLIRKNSRSGQAALMVTVTLPVTLALMGLVVDVGWSYWRSEACRTAAQAGALASALQALSASNFTCGSGVTCTASATTYANCPASPSSPPSNNLQNGCLYVKQNGFTYTGSSNRQNVQYAAYTSSSPVSGSSPSYWVRFVVAEKIPTLFSAVMNQPWMVVSAQATAAIFKPDSGACVYALGHTSDIGIKLDGGANIQATCGVWDNSTSSGSSLSCSNNTTLDAGNNSITLDGGNGCGGTVSPTPLTNQPVASDPLSGVPAPPDKNRCDSTGVTESSVITMPADGVYEVCDGGISINSNGEVDLPSGMYYLKNGTISLQNGTVKGTGITFFLTGNVSGISINGNMVVDVHAPTTGTYHGIVIYQDRNLTSFPNHTLNGGSAMDFEGTIYLPGSYVKYAGGTTQNVTALVANTIDFTGNAHFGVDANGAITGLSTVSAYLIE